MTAPEKNSLRSDIEGLRAVAVLMVLVFHAGIPLTGGYVGVDVFFVISGFLITSLLLREVERSGRISFIDFYARRAKRLLPAASLVMFTTAALAWSLAPRTQLRTFAIDITAAAAYVANWRFADRSVDYLAEDVGRSPLLHFWSLSVEEQFYFVWPMLIIAAVAIARRFDRPLRPTVSATLSLVLIPSLAWAVYFTKQSPAESFFVSTTRLWELSIGALLALALPRLSQLPVVAMRVSAWMGAALLLLSCLYFDASTAWPSFRALAPTVGTALLIAAGTVTTDTIIGKLLSSSLMVWIGGLSYSLYLWHWPLIVVGQDWLQLTGPRWGAAIVVASVVPAWLSYRFVEQPVRLSPKFAFSSLSFVSLGAILSLGAMVVGVLLAQLSGTPHAQSSLEINLVASSGKVKTNPNHLGAGALGARPNKSKAGKAQDHYESMAPAPSVATKDVPEAYALGCQAKFPDVVPKWCKIGDPEGKKRVLVLGDSKILQYYDALDAIGRALGWKILTATKSSCAYTDAVTLNQNKRYEACAKFNKAVTEEMEKNPPYLVITSQNAGSAIPVDGKGNETTRDAMEAGLIRAWSRIRGWGTEVVVVVDNPRPPSKVIPLYECVQKHAGKSKVCAFSRAQAERSSSAPVQKRAASHVPGVHIVDLADYICPGKTCPPVIGDVLVYRQGSHITNTYARSLAPILTERLRQALATSGR